MESGSLLVRLIVTAVAVLFLARLVPLVISAYKSRAVIHRLEKAGLPMPRHNAVFGHLLAAKEASEELPPAAHNTYVLKRLGDKLTEAGNKSMNKPEDLDAFYFDAAPINDPLLVIRDPYLAHQVTSHPVVGSQKPPVLGLWFAPITGRAGRNLFTSNGAEWKHNTSLFQGFFNNSNLDAAIPAVMEQFVLYRDMLRGKAQDFLAADSADSTMFHLEPLTLLLMNDVIGRLILNMDLGNQKSGQTHPLSSTMLQQLSLKFAPSNVVDMIKNFSFVRNFQIWNNSRILDQHILKQINLRVQAYRDNSKRSSHDDNYEGEAQFKAVLDQAIESYYALQPAGTAGTESPDAEFLEAMCAEIRMFFFAGYDSTASSMVLCVYTIWNHPEVLARVRAEHDSVFGPYSNSTLDTCVRRIEEDPNILNQLPYTLAVIKETLRLYPPAAGLRPGHPDLVLTGRDGTRYPTADVLIQLQHYVIQRNARSWPRADEFLPERFLVGPQHELYPEKGAFRPFEHGVRNCTGQALVLKELKAFLVLIAREFDFEDCYAEVYKDEKVDLSNVSNELPYLIDRGAAHMRGHFPCRVRFSGYVSGKAP